LCLQETKISHSAREKVEFDFPGYEEYLNAAERPGYSGTATLIKSDLAKKIKQLPQLLWDNEGRVQIFELPKIYLINCYFPNANGELSRLKFKLDFNNKLLAYVKKLNLIKPVIICGDFNVAHEAMDLTNPKENEGGAGYTFEERQWMTKFLNAGFVDTFRYYHASAREYSWWSYRFMARVRNIGWRIDYFCVSKNIVKYVKEALILNKIMGSDHCPVMIELDLK